MSESGVIQDTIAKIVLGFKLHHDYSSRVGIFVICVCINLTLELIHYI